MDQSMKQINGMEDGMDDGMEFQFNSFRVHGIINICSPNVAVCLPINCTL